MNKKLKTLGLAASVLLSSLPSVAGNDLTLKDALGKYFLFGAAVDTSVTRGHNPEISNIVTANFNSIVAENCMKGESIHPEESRYYWDDADKTVDYARRNNLVLIGHCLVWHSQPPKWMFTDDKGDTVSRFELIDRMYHHITTVVKRYKGKIKGWDVVNEAVNDDGSMRQTPYYKIIGPDYIKLAFQFAHAADPDAELYINDFSMAKPGKRDAYMRIARELMNTPGVRIDAIGMQSHNGMDYPDLEEYEKSIDAFASLGVKVMITEFEVNALPNPKRFGGAEISQNFKYREMLDPYKKGMPKKVQKQWSDRMLGFFKIYWKHRHQISRVTMWGVTDASTWLNDFPVPGRTNYPLLFGRDNKPKPVVKDIIKLFTQSENN